MFLSVLKRTATVGLALALPLCAQQSEPIAGGNPALARWCMFRASRIQPQRRRRTMSSWFHWTDSAGITRGMMER